MRSFFSKLGAVLLVGGLVVSFAATPETAFAQTTPVRAPIRAPAQQGVGAQDRGVGDFLSGLWDTAYGDRDATTGELSQNAQAANSAVRDYVNDPVGVATTEYTDIARQALGTGSGSITDALTARLVGFIAFVMGLIVSFLGKIILLLVNVLLGFLSYNGFADAPPVVIGWKMVRDLTNMFFIVILILSSYATILGWRTNELHVKSVLPKVLLAAVLVNFSKTIVALLIDASQVVMLTFVNAFAAIGAGNFTNALHLPLITSAGYGDTLQQIGSATGTPAIGANGAGQVILDVVLASALQIFLLVVAIGVMLMMVIFVVARIVGLWMLLIFSPIPFLASSLPGTMKKVLGSQVDDFWGRLSGLLTGGPVMAFWLWLTFATLSAQGADERLGLFQNTQAADLGNTFNVAQSGASMFITAIGNAQGLGSYLIAVAMMMMGLEAAMGAASAVKGSAGDLMKSVGKKSSQYAQRAALFAAGGGAIMAAKGAGYVGGAAVGAVDRRYDLRGKMARTVGRFPGMGNSEWLRKQQFANRNDELKRQGEYDKILNNPRATADEKKRAIRDLKVKYGLTGDPAIQRALAQDLARKTGNEKGYDGELKATKDKIKDNVQGSTKDAVVAKRVSDRLGKQEATTRRLADLERQKSLITGTTSDAEDERRKIDDAMKDIRKKNPHLLTDDKERAKQMKEARQNFLAMDDDARGNFEVLSNFANEGAFKKDGGKLSIGDEAAIRATRKKLNGKNLQNFDSMVKFVKESKGGLEMSRLKNLSVEQDAQDNRRVFEATKDGGDFKLSDNRQAAVKSVQSSSTGTTTKAAWLAEEADPIYKENVPMVQAGAETDALISAAKTAGVAQVIGSVGEGANAAESAKMKEAAVNRVAQTTGAGISNANTFLNAKSGYQDAKGNERTNLEVLRDKNVPASVKARITTQYESQVNQVMPILEGLGDLTSDQQVEFMAAMGKNNVGQALNSGLMADPNLKRSVQEVKKVINENAENVREYFDGQDQGKIEQYENYRKSIEYVNSKNQTTEGKALLTDLEAVSNYDEGSRARFLETHENMKQPYAEYAAYKASAAKAGNVHTDINFSKDFAKYRKYDDARAAITQFNGNGGKGSASGDRTRGSGGRRSRS